MRLGRRLLDLFFPPKCVFCRRILPENETELCRACRDRYLSDDVPDVRRGEPSFSVCDSAVYYEDAVAASFKRFKFGGMQSYAACYGRLLAMTVLRRGREFDVLTYVPISDRRRRRRGYDQARLIAEAAARELPGGIDHHAAGAVNGDCRLGGAGLPQAVQPENEFQLLSVPAGDLQPQPSGGQPLGVAAQAQGRRFQEDVTAVAFAFQVNRSVNNGMI